MRTYRAQYTVNVCVTPHSCAYPSCGLLSTLCNCDALVFNKFIRFTIWICRSEPIHCALVAYSSTITAQFEGVLESEWVIQLQQKQINEMITLHYITLVKAFGS